MTTYYKAVRPDGMDFFSGTVRWLPPVGEPLPEGGLIVRHPTATTPSRPATQPSSTTLVIMLEEASTMAT